MDTNQNQKNRTVLITGAAGRLGFEMAKECLDLGYHVVIHYRTSDEPAASFFRDDRRASFIKADLTKSPQKFMEEVRALPTPPLEGLINSAALFKTGDLSSPAHFNDILTINTLVPIQLTAEFTKAVKTGWVINITDARVRPMNKKYQSYRVSKLFLDEITKQMAFLYAPLIRVNAIAPGVILPSAEETMPQFENLLASIPLGNAGNPNNIRQALRFLIENDYVTGSIIPVDGGWHL